MQNRGIGLARWMGWTIPLLIVSLVAGGIAYGWTRYRRRRPRFDGHAITGVRRTSLHPSLVVSGQVESAKRTVVRCELENLKVGMQGQRLTAGGASTLIKVVPNGSVVKQGDVLAVLDSSDYQELVRLESIKVQIVKADRLQAQLNHEIAQLAVVEFREGTMQQTIEDFRGRLSLAESDLSREQDRVRWAHAMGAKGYLALSAVRTEEFNLAKMEEALKNEKFAFDLFQRYSAPKTLHELNAAVLGAEATLDYQEMRSRKHIARLQMLEKQVEACTIRAPHDGCVIYANDTRHEVAIEEGMDVRQKQRLFYLPDLNHMEIVANLHESIVEDVHPGMPATIVVEGLPGHELTGRVQSISPLPAFEWHSDIRNFDAIVKIDRVPKGLLPGMTAQVEIRMPDRDDVLAVPTESVATIDGHDVCLVVHEQGLERREIQVGQATYELTEVVAGLSEGEQVVLDPDEGQEAEAEAEEEAEAEAGNEHEKVAGPNDAPRSQSARDDEEVTALH